MQDATVLLLSHVSANNTKCYADINRLYAAHLPDAEKSASLYSEHGIVANGSIARCKIALRATGVFATATDIEIKSFVKSYWPRPYGYATHSHTRKIEFEAFVSGYHSRKELKDAVYDDNLIVLLCMSDILNKAVKPTELANMMTSVVNQMLLEKVPTVNEPALEAWVNRNCASGYPGLQRNPECDAVDAILMYNHIYESVNVRDLASLVMPLKILKSSSNSEMAYLVLLYALQAQIEAYADLKSEYRESNPDAYEAKIAELSLKLMAANRDRNAAEAVSNTVKARLTAMRTLEKENMKLNKELEEAHEIANEMNALRSFMFEYSTAECIPTDTLRHDFTALLIGGSDAYRQQVNKSFPNITCVSPDINSIDKLIVQSAPAVLFFAGKFSHTLYYSVINQIRGTDKKIGYLKYTNKDLMEQEINDILGGNNDN